VSFRTDLTETVVTIFFSLFFFFVFKAYLFGQLFLTQLVQREEFPGEDDVVDETHSSQFDTDDDLSVWHHHGHCTEVDLQVLWQLLTTRIARVLEQEK
jgi:hypothetical protein